MGPCIGNWLAGFFLMLGIVLLGGGMTRAQVSDTVLLNQKPRHPLEAPRPPSDPGPGKAAPHASPHASEEARAPAASAKRLVASFVKAGDTLEPGSMFFNVLKIENKASRPRGVRLNVLLPPRAKVLLQPQDQDVITIEGGQAHFVPVRVSFPANVEGGIPFELRAQCLDEAGDNILLDIPPCHVQFRKLRKWRIVATESKFYVASNDEGYTEVPLQVFNQGNSSERILLEARYGKLLELEGGKGGTYQAVLPIKPAQDTVPILRVRCLPSQTEEVGDAYRIRVKAQAEGDSTVHELSLIFERKEVMYRRATAEEEAPLIISLNQTDLTGPQGGTSMDIYGNLLLKEDRSFHYRYSFRANFLQGMKELDPVNTFLLNSNLSLQYHTSITSWRLGNVGGGSGGVSVSGKGIGLSHQLNDRHKVGAVVAAQVGAPVWGLAGSYQGVLREDLMVNAGMTYKVDKKEQRVYYAPSFGANFTLLNRHRFNVLATATRMTHTVGAKPVDQKGIGYQMGYSMEHNNLKLNVKSEYGSKGFIGGTAGSFKLRAKGAYQFGSGRLSLGYASSHRQSDEVSEEGDLQAVLRQHHQTLSSNLAFAFGNTAFGLGASYATSMSHKELLSLGETDLFGTRTYGFYLGAATQSRRSGWAFNPSARLNLHQATTTNSGMVPTSLEADVRLKARFPGGSMAASYEYGTTHSLLELAAGQDKRYNQWLKFNANYQLFSMSEYLKVGTAAELAYQTEEQVLDASVKADIQVETETGWTFTLNAQVDPLGFARKTSLGEMTSLNMGSKKVFDMPQPRLKYYTLIMVFFKDVDGDRQRGEGEQGVSPVMVDMEQSEQLSVSEAEPPQEPFKPPSLISDETGKLSFIKVPQGYYILSLTELFPPTQFVNLQGKQFEVKLNQHTTLYVPYAKSVTITGKIRIARDEYSRQVGISPRNIRVTVQDESGAFYYTLSDARGNYVISVPYSSSYAVSIKNVLGSKFDLPDGEQSLATDNEFRHTLDFHFKEKGRSINFGN